MALSLRPALPRRHMVRVREANTLIRSRGSRGAWELGVIYVSFRRHLFLNLGHPSAGKLLGTKATDFVLSLSHRLFSSPQDSKRNILT